MSVFIDFPVLNLFWRLLLLPYLFHQNLFKLLKSHKYISERTHIYCFKANNNSWKQYVSETKISMSTHLTSDRLHLFYLLLIYSNFIYISDKGPGIIEGLLLPFRINGIICNCRDKMRVKLSDFQLISCLVKVTASEKIWFIR